ncbi:MAG: mechanosensitive ion channel [Pseudomonadales bacterium]|nr:mechanosensitive ion channel [Pseudomonadales bacterium]
MKLGLHRYALTLLLTVAALSVSAQTTTTSSTPGPTTVSNQQAAPTITLTQISDQTLSTQKLIEKLKPVATQPLEYEELNDKLTPLKKQLSTLQTQTSSIINDRKSGIDEIRANQSQWRFVRDQLIKDQQKIRTRGAELEDALAQLTTEENTWQQIQIQLKDAPEVSYDGNGMKTSLANIAALRKQLSTPLQEAIALEKEWQELIDLTDDVQVSLKNDETYLRNNLLTNIQSPIWEMSNNDFQVTQSINQSISDQLKLTAHYATRYKTHFILIFCLTISIVFFLYKLQHYSKKSQEHQTGIELKLPILQRPFSTLIVCSVSLAFVILPFPPQLLKSTLSLLLFIPVVRLGMPRLPTIIRPLAWLVSIFFVVNNISSLTITTTGLQRLWILSSAIIGFFGCIHALVRVSTSDKKRLPLWRLMRAAIWLVLFAALVAIIGSSFGATTLAQFLVTGISYSTYAGLFLVVLAGTIIDLAVAAIYQPGSESSRLISNNRSLLIRYINKLATSVCSLFWIHFMLAQYALWDGLVDVTLQTLAKSLTIGNITVSVSDVLTVSLTIWLSFKLSQILRFILTEDIAHRKRMARGTPEAIGTLMHYSIILSGFIFAISILGIDLSKLTIMAGALGVGIGIGLQDVVNNFTSGLILLFEQNIKPADTIQCNTINGRVTHIGMRCSIVLTGDGAEVIVPNGQLVSAQVINWTHSDQKRRIIIPIQATSNTDPQKVIDTLLTVAKNDRDVMEDPQPAALLLRFSPGCMDFELRAWVHNGEFTNEVNSRLCIAIAQAFAQAGINIPLTQHDVYIRQMPDTSPLPSGTR